ncbi:MAG: arginase family protein [bacterium]|nr:arginase family protein [bacterium]
MVGFLGTPVLYEQELDLQHDFLIYGIDDTASIIREYSLGVNTYSPELRRDFNNFSAYDSSERFEGVNLLLGDSSADFQLPMIYIGGTICAPYMTSDVNYAYALDALPQERTVWYLGCRSYTAEEGDWARYNQRLMAAHEVSIDTALKTSIMELNGVSARLILNIDILDPVWAPAVKRPAGFGCTPGELLKTLRCLEGASIAMVQVCGVYSEDEHSSQAAQTGRMAAEFARELALTVFPGRLKAAVAEGGA